MELLVSRAVLRTTEIVLGLTAYGLSPALRVEGHISLHLDVLSLVLEDHCRLIVDCVVMIATAAHRILTQ